MYKNFLFKLFASLFFIILSIFTVNFIIDPGNIYLNKILLDKHLSEYYYNLKKSKFGIINSNISERQTKVSLAKQAFNYDCVIIGSSRVMQYSSIRKPESLKSCCSDLINLGVSGGSIEDILIFSYLIQDKAFKPKKIFINIDLYTLKFNMDSRWQQNELIYNKIITLLKENDIERYKTYNQKVLKNLINFEYFLASLDELINNNVDVEKKITGLPIRFAKKFDILYGYPYENKGVYLQDGSYVYSKEQINKWKNKLILNGGGNYKLKGEFYDEKVITVFKKLISLLQYNGISVYFLKNPFHHNFFKKGDTKAVIFLKKIDKIITSLSKESNVKVYGSFYPDDIGCKENEFYDVYHPKKECIDKIVLKVIE